MGQRRDNGNMIEASRMFWAWRGENMQRNGNESVERRSCVYNGEEKQLKEKKGYKAKQWLFVGNRKRIGWYRQETKG